jgi:hypothetical protein
LQSTLEDALVAGVSEQYRQFAERECKGYSPAYYRLATEIAEDQEILVFVAEQPVTQPNLLFAAIQFLTGPEKMPLSAGTLRRFLRSRGDEVAALMKTRRTQTNEVGRCAALLPALPSGPLAIVEVGASAGLCLLLDHFYYDYGRKTVGESESPIHITCNVRGPAPIPRHMPKIAWRHGLDLNPLDVRNADDANWLLACVWPDHPKRRRRLESAIALAQETTPLLTAGDLIDDLPNLLSRAPQDAHLVVFHSAALVYLSKERRAQFGSVLAEVSERRNVVWVSNEGRGVVAELAPLAPPETGFNFLLGLTHFRKGRRMDSLLALAHPHGAELTWLSATTQ